MARPRKITPKLKNNFISLLANTGNVSKVCMALNISREHIYQARRKSKAFAVKWDSAMETARQLLEDEAWRRAFEGVEKPIFYKGQQCFNGKGEPLFIREYSDHLMTVLLNGNFPDKYRYNTKIDANVSGELTIKVVKFAGDNDTK